MKASSKSVMAGLVPAIHAPPAPVLSVSVDTRHKAGYDDVCGGATSVIAGLVPAIHATAADPLSLSVDAPRKAGHDVSGTGRATVRATGSDKIIVKIVPIGIRREDQPYFPGARPVLHGLLSLDSRADVGVRLDIDQPFQSVTLCKALDQTLAVFVNPSREVRCYTGVECTIRPVRHDVHPDDCHSWTVLPPATGSNAFVDGRDKPGHDGKGVPAGGRAVACATVARTCLKKF
jgi:hypothetical protein